jgi:hypothetical protein
MLRKALFLLLLAPAFLHAETKWTYASSDHFEVYTTAGDHTARDAIVFFERIQAFFTDFMKVSPVGAHPTRLIVFSGDREYRPYRPNESATAFYQPGPDRDYIVMRSLDQDSYPIVVHEYTHLVIRQAGDRFPPWLNEGLAEFFSTLEPAGGGKMAIGRVPVARLRYLNGPTELIRVARLFAVDHDSPEYNKSAHAGTFYSESWALVHMLMTDPQYRPKAQALLARMDADSDSAAAFQSIYGKATAAVEQDLYAYIHKQAFGYYAVAYKEPKAFDKAPVRVADGFEAGLVSANLRAVTGARESDARAAFDALARQKADDVQLVESRAYFELRHGHRDAALPFMARATELGSTNAALYRDYAILASLDDSHREQLLIKAVELSPEDVQTRLLLSNTQLRERKGAAALATLAPITRVRINDAYELYMTLASAHGTEGHWTDAAAAATLAVKHARTSQEAASAQDFLESVNQMAKAPSAPASPRSGLVDPATRPAVRPAASASPTLETGRLTNMICGSVPPILEITTDKGVLRLLIDDPLKVQIVGQSAPTMSLNCGTQNVPVRVGYEPTVDATRKTVGNLRMIDFSQG